MKRRITVHTEGESRDQAEGRALALIGLEWAGEPHVIVSIGATCFSDGGWKASVTSASPDEGEG